MKQVDLAFEDFTAPPASNFTEPLDTSAFDVTNDTPVIIELGGDWQGLVLVQTSFTEISSETEILWEDVNIASSAATWVCGFIGPQVRLNIQVINSGTLKPRLQGYDQDSR
jgi:hypothetical protein